MYSNDNQDFRTYLIESNPADLLLFLDYDDCLDVSTRRVLTDEQIEILWDLNRLTQGGVIVTTNSDGRTVQDILPNFPVISEFATVLRHIDNNYPLQYRKMPPNCKAAFEVATKMAHNKGITTTHDADILNGESPAIKIEEKEMGIAIVFGMHEVLKNNSLAIAEQAFLDCGFDSNEFEIEVGKDAVEIKVKNARKVDALQVIERYPGLAERLNKVFMGDSGSDWDGMKQTNMGVVVGRAINEEKMQGIRHFRLTSDIGNFAPTWGFLRELRDSYNAKTAQARPGYRAPAVR